MACNAELALRATALSPAGGADRRLARISKVSSRVIIITCTLVRIRECLVVFVIICRQCLSLIVYCYRRFRYFVIVCYRDICCPLYPAIWAPGEKCFVRQICHETHREFVCRTTLAPSAAVFILFRKEGSEAWQS